MMFVSLSPLWLQRTGKELEEGERSDSGELTTIRERAWKSKKESLKCVAIETDNKPS